MTEARLWLGGKVSWLVREWISWWRGLFAFDTARRSLILASPHPCRRADPPFIPLALSPALHPRTSHPRVVISCIRLNLPSFSFFPFSLVALKRAPAPPPRRRSLFLRWPPFPIDVGTAAVAWFLLQLCAYISAQITIVGYIQVTVWSVVWGGYNYTSTDFKLKKASTIAQVFNRVAYSFSDIDSFVVTSLPFPTARQGGAVIQSWHQTTYLFAK